MQHTIRTFRASSMDEAMDLVRQELGPDAVVVDSKEIARRRILPWSSARTEFEILAQRQNGPQDSVQATDSHMNGLTMPRTVRSLAETIAPPKITRDLFPSAHQRPTKSGGEFHSNSERLSSPQQRTESFSPSTKSDVLTGQTIDQSTQSYQTSLESLQAIVTQLERQTRLPGTTEVPSELFQHYRNLVNADVEDDVARDLMTTLRRHLSVDSVNSASTVTAMLTALIEREMRCAPPIQPKRGRREIVTIVGPTGVGKTTTIAKLAGHFHLREGLRVGLITIDTYRVGAVEQLQTYADIMQIPLRTASNPEELRIAIDQLDDVDLILIDTAGRSPFDEPKLNELRDLVKVASSQHVLLLISLTAGPGMISRIVDQFACASPTSLVLTKLDEVPGHGGLLSIARKIQHPVSYITTGQDVPDQLEPAHPNRLAQLILGRGEFRQVLQ